MISCGPIPLISPLLYRLSIRQTGRRAAAGNEAAVVELAAIFCTAQDPVAQDIAAKGLRNLPSPEQVDILCRETLLWDNPALSDLVGECRYLPSGPADLALFLFCSGCIDDLLLFDMEEHRPLLSQGYARASCPVRARVRKVARRDKTCTILADALLGTSIIGHTGDWSYDEWEVVITGMICNQKWDVLWQLVDLAPAPLAIPAITALRDAGWAPEGDNLLLWNEILAALPKQWDHPITEGKTQRPFGRSGAQLTRLCFSPDGSLLATGCCDGIISVLRMASAGLVAEFAAGSGAILNLAISADNNYLVSGNDSGMVHCHCIQNRTRQWSWKEECDATVLRIPNDGNTVLIGDDGGNLHVLDIRDGRILSSVPVYPSPITTIAASPASRSYAFGHTDGTVSIVNDGEETKALILKGSGSPVRSLSYNPEGTACLAIYETTLPAHWDIRTGTKVRVFSGQRGRIVCSVASEEGEWFAIGSDDHMLRIWIRDKTAPTAIIPLYNCSITSCTATAGGSHLCAAFHDGTIRIYEMPQGELVRENKGHKKTVTSCIAAPEGNHLATVSWDGTTKVWRLPKMEIIRTLDSHAGGIAALAGPSGTLIVTVTEDGIARVIDATDSMVIRTIDLYTPFIRTAAMSPDGSYLASAGADASIRIWSIRDGSLSAAADRLRTSQRCCTFLPNNSALITGGWDGNCRIYQVPDLRQIRTLSGHTSVVTCCTTTRDGSILVTGSNDTTVRIWNTSERTAYNVIRESRSEIGALAITHDGTILAAGSSDGIIRLYTLPYGTPVGELTGLPDAITCLTFTPESCLLVAGHVSGFLTIYRMSDKTLLRTVPEYPGAVTGIAILSDGKTLITTGRDGSCRFHTLPITPFLVRATLADLQDATKDRDTSCGEHQASQWEFLRILLAMRFRSEIQICPPIDAAGCYDIQIVG